jgi:hypothetical protein
MAIAPTATDMPQNKLYENDNLGTAKVVRGGRLTTGEIRFAALQGSHRRDCLWSDRVLQFYGRGREMAMALVDHPACLYSTLLLTKRPLKN